MSFQRRKIVRALSAKGFVVLRETGPHTVYADAAGRKAVVPHGGQIRRGTARAIARQARINWDEFQKEIR